MDRIETPCAIRTKVLNFPIPNVLLDLRNDSVTYFLQDLDQNCLLQSQGANPFCYLSGPSNEISSDQYIFPHTTRYSFENSKKNQLVGWSLEARSLEARSLSSSAATTKPTTTKPTTTKRTTTKRTTTKRRTTHVVYFHGNGENKAKAFFRYKIFRDLLLASGMTPERVVIHTFDYRGFGDSEGFPTELGLYDDAISWWARLTNAATTSGEFIAENDQVFIYGHSLGTVVATSLLDHLVSSSKRKNVQQKNVQQKNVQQKNVQQKNVQQKKRATKKRATKKRATKKRATKKTSSRRRT